MEEPFEVLLKNNTLMIFDPRNWEFIGKRDATEYSPYGDTEWLITECLYLGSTSKGCRWVLITWKAHCEAPWTNPPSISQISPDEAESWVFSAEVECPPSLAALRSKRLISPENFEEVTQADAEKAEGLDEDLSIFGLSSEWSLISMPELIQAVLGQKSRHGETYARSTIYGWKKEKGFPTSMTWNEVRDWVNKKKRIDIGPRTKE